MKRRLGRRIPKDFDHVAKYPLRATAAIAKPVPVTVGINWYSNFDKPVKGSDGRFWIGRGSLGRIEGGHSVVMPHANVDLKAWYLYYNQGREGACVGFASSRMMSLLNRKRYDARWLWNEAKKIDEWVDTNPGDDNGTSVRAAMDVLRTQGHVYTGICKSDHGICANRWATSIDDLFGVLQNGLYSKLGAIPILNSWGEDYPRIVWMPCEVWQRLMNEDGEFTMITDK